MTTYRAKMREHLAGEITTLCHCWKLARTDGVVQGFTDHDEALTVDGVSYEPSSGFSASEARQSLGLAAGTAELEGALSSDRLSESDIAAGLYDGATIETLLVNWRRPEDFAAIRTATIGRITRSDGRLVAELSSVAHRYDQPGGRRVRLTCDAEVGDGRCGVALTGGYRAEGVVIGVTEGEVLSVSGLDGFAEHWFTGGVLTWTSGVNAGRQARVAAHATRDGVSLRLWPGPGFAASPPDAFVVTAGCDKSFAACRLKFANAVNFRGFPHLPGNAAAYSYVTADGVFDGSPLVP